MTDDTDDELARLREQTSHGDRLDEGAGDGREAALADALVARLDAIDEGEAAKTVSVWDARLAALFQTLAPPEDEGGDEFAEERAALAGALRDRLGVEDDDPADRSELIRLTLRAGLDAAGPEYLDALRDAVRERATRDV